MSATDDETLHASRVAAAVDAVNALWSWGWYDIADRVREEIRNATCEHEWTERDQGPGFRWAECWLCGEQTDYR